MQRDQLLQIYNYKPHSFNSPIGSDVYISIGIQEIPYIIQHYDLPVERRSDFDNIYNTQLQCYTLIKQLKSHLYTKYYKEGSYQPNLLNNYHKISMIEASN